MEIVRSYDPRLIIKGDLFCDSDCKKRIIIKECNQRSEDATEDEPYGTSKMLHIDIFFFCQATSFYHSESKNVPTELIFEERNNFFVLDFFCSGFFFLLVQSYAEKSALTSHKSQNFEALFS